MADYTQISTVDTCKEIRESLKDLFPKTTFKVNKQREYAVSVFWEDGPSMSEVDEVLETFRGIVVDDSHYGTTKRSTFYRERGYWSYNLEYIHANRKHSGALVLAIATHVVQKFGLEMPEIVVSDHDTHVVDNEQRVGNDYLSNYIHTLMRKSSAIWLKSPTSPADKFREWGDGLQKQIDDKRRSRPTHTHRMARMAQSALDDARQLELAQSKFRALADAWDKGLVPDCLRYVNTKAQVMRLATNKHSPSPRLPRDYDTSDYKAFVKAGLGASKLYHEAYAELYGMGDENAGKKTVIDQLKEKEMALVNAKIPGFFPTPDSIVQLMLDHADLRAGKTVLEPSAGKGNIADAIQVRHPEVALEVVEWNNSLNDILKLKGHTVIGSDCFDLKPDNKQYDVICANPPFDKTADVDHVLHYYELLKPGGRMVSIMSASPFFRQDAKAVKFREWLADVGTGEPLPDNAFMEGERKTSVKTYMVIIDKPAKHTDADTRSDKWVKDGNQQIDLIVNQHPPTQAGDTTLKPETVKFTQIAPSVPTRVRAFQRGDFVKNTRTAETGWLDFRHHTYWSVNIYHPDGARTLGRWTKHDLELTPAPTGKQQSVQPDPAENPLNYSTYHPAAGSGQVMAPNPHYYCSHCNKDLKTKRERLVGNLVPDMHRIDDLTLCVTCFYKHLDARKAEASTGEVAQTIVEDVTQQLLKPTTFKIGDQVHHRLLTERQGKIVQTDPERGYLVDRGTNREWWKGSDLVVLEAPVIDPQNIAQLHPVPEVELKEVCIVEIKPIQLSLF